MQALATAVGETVIHIAVTIVIGVEMALRPMVKRLLVMGACRELNPRRTIKRAVVLLAAWGLLPWPAADYLLKRFRLGAL